MLSLNKYLDKKLELILKSFLLSFMIMIISYSIYVNINKSMVNSLKAIQNES